MIENLPSTKILGTSVTTATKAEILDFTINRIKNSKKKFYIVTPNPEILVHASLLSSFQKVLNDATVSLPDGVGVLAAGNILKKGIKERITGIDFMLDLCKECARVGLSIGFLGGKSGVAEKTSKCLREKYPDLVVNFVGEEWPSKEMANDKWRMENKDKQGTSSSTINHLPSHVDILFVAFGAPKQEEWIAKNLENLPVTAAMGVGGAFDYIAGVVPRAPKAVRNIGMEWAFRLARQPWRAKRQLSLPVFAFKILKERISSK